MRQKSRVLTVVPGLCAALIGVVIILQALSMGKAPDWVLGLVFGVILGLAVVSLIKLKRSASHG